MGQVNSWATAEKDEAATAEKTEGPEQTPSGSRVVAVVFPFEGQEGTVLDTASLNRPEHIHPARVIAVQLDDEEAPAWFAHGELRRVAAEPTRDESHKNASQWVGCWVRVARGEHKGYFDDKVCEVLEVKAVALPSGKSVLRAYVQHPPSTTTGIEDTQIKTAWVDLEALENWYASSRRTSEAAPDFSALSENVFEQRHAIARELSATEKVEQQLIALADAISAFLDSREGRKALSSKNCSTGTLCEVLGLSGTREDNQRIADIMTRLGFRRVKVSKDVEQRTAFAYTWSKDNAAEEWSAPTERMVDEWESLISNWLASWAGQQIVRLNMCTTGRICDALGFSDMYADRLRVARIMRGLGYEQITAVCGGVELRVWRPKDGELKAAGTEQHADTSTPNESIEPNPVLAFLMALRRCWSS